MIETIADDNSAASIHSYPTWFIELSYSTSMITVAWNKVVTWVKHLKKSALDIKKWFSFVVPGPLWALQLYAFRFNLIDRGLMVISPIQHKGTYTHLKTIRKTKRGDYPLLILYFEKRIHNSETISFQLNLMSTIKIIHFFWKFYISKTAKLF
jgi:hypothetical protein